MQEVALCKLCRTQQRLAYNVPPSRPLGPDLHRTTRELAGTAKRSIRRNCNKPHHRSLARHSSLVPSPVHRSWGCHSSVSEASPSWGQHPLPPSSPPTTEAHTAWSQATTCAQPAFVAAVRIFFARRICVSLLHLWDAPGEEVSGRSQVRTTKSNPLYGAVLFKHIMRKSSDIHHRQNAFKTSGPMKYRRNTICVKQ